MPISLLGLLAALTLPADTVGAERLSLELRAGASVGTVSAAATGFEWRPRESWRLGAWYAAARSLALYGGYGSSAFGCQDGFCRDRTVSFTSRGFDLGVQLHSERFWIRGGGVRHSLEAAWQEEDAPGLEVAGSKVGWEVGAGLAIRAGPRVRVTPGLRYGTYRARFSGGTDEDAVAYLSADVGVRVALLRALR